MNNIFKKYNEISLIKRIIVGLIIGIFLGVVYRMNGDNSFIQSFQVVSIFGNVFVTALRSIAPILVFFLIISAISQHKKGNKTNIGGVIKLYLVATFIAALVATIVSFLSPITLNLDGITAADASSSPSSIWEVLGTLVLNLVQNPLLAIAQGNFIGVLFWSILIGVALIPASEQTKNIFVELSDAISQIVRWVINLAPFGIMGLVFTSISDQGLVALVNYMHLIIVLVLSFLFMALIVNPLITYIYIGENPYPLVFDCLANSGVNAFFTRSSAANIPINLNLCEKHNVNPDMSNISIPLGATINMAGAAITITTITLATCNTIGIDVSFGMALLLSLVAAISACGASGVAGGSLLLIPLACSLFGISSEIAASAVGVGFVISVIQDSMETAINSSSDALYTIIVDKKQKKLEASN